MSRPATYALTVLAAPELLVGKDHFKRLEAAAVAQCGAVGTLESQAAAGAIIAGITLHRVKASLPHGKFDAWKAQKLAKANFWTPSTAKLNANFYMRLALVFLEKSRSAKSELLALPADGKAELKLDATPAGRKLATSLEKFVGGSSLTELLIKHGIKGVGLKTALSAGAADDDLTPAQKAEQARNCAWQEAWNAVQTLRAALTEPEKIQLINEVKQLETLKAELVESAKLADERLKALSRK